MIYNYNYVYFTHYKHKMTAVILLKIITMIIMMFIFVNSFFVYFILTQ